MINASSVSTTVIITDKTNVASRFNNDFTNVGNLSKKTPSIPDSPLQYLCGTYEGSLFLTPIHKEEIISIINTVRNSAPSQDELGTDIMKSVIGCLAKPFNLSITEGFSQMYSN